MRAKAYLAWRRLKHRVGRRGASLMFFALLDFVFALSLISPLPESQRNPATIFIQSIAPLWVWGLLWLLAGVVCLSGAFVRNDQLAFFAAVGIKVLWGLIYLLMQIIVHIERAWLGATIWLCLGMFVFIISTWPEPPPNIKVGVKRP
jgi:hypothetical protein